jgi:uncharacterized metal-binding protein YceD (DUF177 family)
MKIHIREINPELTIDIAGHEQWLQKIYGDFEVPAGTAQPLITGQLTLLYLEGGAVSVKGHLNFTPYIHCGLCGKLTPWLVDLPINVRYSPEFTNDAKIVRDKTLNVADLDDYFLTNDQLDIEELVNDSVQTSMPSCSSAEEEMEDKCNACQASLKVAHESDEQRPGAPVTSTQSETAFARLLRESQEAKKGQKPEKANNSKSNKIKH